MALATNPIDINTGTTGVVLPREISREVWNTAMEESVVMRLARRIDLPGYGINVPIVDAEVAVDIVAESTEKPVVTPEIDNKFMAPIKIAGIIPFSNEFRRDMSRVYDTIVRDAPRSIFSKFDRLVFNGVNGSAPATGFDTLADATAVALAGTDIYADLVSAKTAVANGDGMLNGWVFAPQGEAVLLSVVDGNNRPLFIDSPTSDGGVGRLLGEQVYYTKHLYKAGTPNLIGVAGDWDQAYYGVVEDITVKFSDQATINDGTNQINLWQRNMFAILIEATLGFAVKDKAAFVTLTD